MSTTWNPADKGTNISLSSTNHVMTATGSGNGKARGTSSHGSGTWYIEFSNFVANTNGQSAVGFANATETLNDNDHTTNFCGVYVNGALVGVGNGVAPSITGLDGINTSLAIDIPNKLIWARSNGGLWNNSGTADPAAGVGGLLMDTFAGGYTFFPCAFCQNNDGSHPSSATLNAGDSAFTYTPPAGFVGWDVPQVVTQTQGTLMC